MASVKVSTVFMSVTKIKRKFKLFLENERVVRKAIERVETFNKDKHLFNYETFDEYYWKDVNTKRTWLSRLTRFCFFITIIKQIISIIYGGITIKVITMDIFYLLDKGIVYPIVFISGYLTVFLLMVIINHLEMNHNFYPAKLFYMLKYNSFEYPLSPQNHRSFGLKFNLMSRYLLEGAFNPKSIMAIYFLVFSLSLILFMEIPICVWSIISLIFWNVVNYWIVKQLIGLAGLLGSLSFGQMLYLKNKFNEINTKIESSLKERNIPLLMNSILEHNSAERLTKNINDSNKYIIMVAYYMGTFVAEVIMYHVFQDKSTIIGQLLGIGVTISMTSFIPISFVMCTMISNDAHRSYSKLYTIINQDIGLTVRQRWRLLAFIETLSGPQIGFYCYDLFPMNSYKFYQYLLITGKNYFLLMELFSKYSARLIKHS